ncbi:MAG: hypothetical protein AAGC74_14435 [Verrucomicrobiota bacterium]
MKLAFGVLAGWGVLLVLGFGAEQSIDLKDLENQQAKLAEARKQIERVQRGEVKGGDLEQQVAEVKQQAIQVIGEAQEMGEMEVEQGALISRENQAKLISLGELLAKGVPADYQAKLFEMAKEGLAKKDLTESERAYYEAFLQVVTGEIGIRETPVSVNRK